MEELEIKTKVCSHCKQEKPVSEFYPSSTTKDGYRSQCIECAKESAKEANRKAREDRRRAREATKKLRENGSYRKLTLGEKKQLLEKLRSDNPLSAYHPRELFEYLASLGYKMHVEFKQEFNYG